MTGPRSTPLGVPATPGPLFENPRAQPEVGGRVEGGSLVEHVTFRANRTTYDGVTAGLRFVHQGAVTGCGPLRTGS